MYPFRTKAVIARLEAIVMDLLQFSFWKPKLICQGSGCFSISTDNFRTCIFKHTKLNERKIQAEFLALHFCLMVGEVVIHIRQVCVLGLPWGFESILLAIMSMGSGDKPTMEEYYSYLKFFLSVYGNSMMSWHLFVTMETKQCICSRCGIHLSCRSYSLHQSGDRRYPC